MCWLIDSQASNTYIAFSSPHPPGSNFLDTPLELSSSVSEDDFIMFLPALPTEVLLIIFECVETVTSNERNPFLKRNATQRTVERIFRHTETSSNAEAHLSGEALRTFKNLRLTSRRLKTLASRAVFRSISLSDNPESWINVANVAAHPDLAWNVEVLTLSMPQLCDVKYKDGNRTTTRSKRRIPKHCPAQIKLVLFPFLKSIQCLKWKLVKVGAIGLPAKGFVIKPSPRMRNRGYLWKTASALSDITSFGWEFQYLHLSLLDQTRAWRKYVKTLCISKLQTLDIDFSTDFKGWIGAHVLESILPMIEDLPCLRTFKLKQYHCGEDPAVHQDLAANVFKLLENRNWPGITKLEVSRPRTRQEDFLGFLLRHKDTLQYLHYSVPEQIGAVSGWMDEHDLERWIENNISPTAPWVRYWFEAAYEGAAANKRPRQNNFFLVTNSVCFCFYFIVAFFLYSVVYRRDLQLRSTLEMPYMQARGFFRLSNIVFLWLYQFFLVCLVLNDIYISPVASPLTKWTDILA